jgi:peptide/nickel transport system substrate-binding protein
MSHRRTEAVSAPPDSGLTRRELLRLAGMVGAGTGLAGALAACGAAAKDESPTGKSARRHGTLTLAIDGTSAVNDPAFYTTLGDWMAVDCVCRGLTFISFETNTVEPDLAESWEISADRMTYTFRLRRGVTFHDGSTLTSADVVASLNRQFDDADPTLPKGASPPLKSLGGKVSAVDDHTVRLVIPAPDATTLARLSDIGGRIISSAALAKYGKDIGKHLVGTGPFAFVSATSGESVVLEAFEKFRLGRPPLDRLVLQQVQDPSSIISSLISGDISATQFTPYSAAKRLRASGVKTYETPFGFDAFIMLDARKPALAELEVRLAINAAVDRRTLLAQAFYDIGTLPLGYAIPPAQPGYDRSLADLSRYDPAEARALLKSVGASGRTLHLMAASDSWHPKAAQIVAQNLEDVGFKVVTTSVDPATYFSKLFDAKGDQHELMIWERNSYVPDPDNMVGAMAATSGLYGDVLTGLSTLDGAERLTEMLYRAKNLPNGPDRTTLYSQIQRMWAEEYMVLVMLACSTNLVASGTNVHGMNVDALANHRCFLDKASV